MHDYAESARAGLSGRRLRVIGLAAAILACASAHQALAQNLVQNPGFEDTPNDGSNTSPGWTLDPTSSTTYLNGTATANSGDWAAEFFATDAAGATQGTLSQTITTVPSTTYIVSFYLENEGGPHNSFLATFGGQTVLSLTDADAFGYTRYSATIIATANSALLSFRGQQGPSDFLLDDVSVVAQGAPAPVTGGGLLSVAVVLAGFAVRRTKAGGLRLSVRGTN